MFDQGIDCQWVARQGEQEGNTSINILKKIRGSKLHFFNILYLFGYANVILYTLIHCTDTLSIIYIYIYIFILYIYTLGGLSYCFFFPLPGEMIQYDKHLFQRG